MDLFYQFDCFAEPNSLSQPGSEQVRGPDGPNGILFVSGDLSLLHATDFNGDHQVDPADFAILSGHWLMPGDSTSGDATGDGFVDPADFALLAGDWLLGVAAHDAESLGLVPEPSTGLLAFLGLTVGALLAVVTGWQHVVCWSSMSGRNSVRSS